MKKSETSVENTQAQSTVEPGTVVVGGTRHRRLSFRRHKKQLIIAGVIVLVLAAIVGIVIWRNQKVTDTTTGYQPDTIWGSRDFYNMQPEEVPGQVKPLIGISVDDLKTKPINGKLL